MSGVIAVLHTDGSPVNPEHLAQATAAMAFRAPDAQASWHAGSVGLGHALLRTMDDTAPDEQPATLPGASGQAALRITAQARIDGQHDLRRRLRDAGQNVATDATDAQLILHAYMAWGEACLDHLIGDFAFALWDGRRQALFCARDHFGVRPLFYAHAAGRLVVGNTVQAMRRHPAVPDDLDELYIADFLMFGGTPDALATPFARIRRLAPGHCLGWSAGGGLRIRRYWQLPDYGGERLRPGGDYVEAFWDALQTAVADRLRTRRIGVQLSGGMDSTALAATARHLLRQDGRPFELNGLCVGAAGLIDDEEPAYAQVAASHLGMPLHLLDSGDYRLMQPAPPGAPLPPEPGTLARLAETVARDRQSAALARVWLTGWDGDALLSESVRPCLLALARQRQYGRLGLALWCLLRDNGALGARTWWMAARRGLRARVASMQQPVALPAPASSAPPANPGFPDWLDSGLEQRLHLRQRWQDQLQQEATGWAPSGHPLRPYAYTVFQHMAGDARLYDQQDAGFTGQPIEQRHPLMDLRLVEFGMTLPVQPWVVKKHILREAMRGRLPEKIRRRPKTPLPTDPAAAQMRRDVPHLPAWQYDESVLRRFVKEGILAPEALAARRAAWLDNPLVLGHDLRLLELQHWLRSLG